MIVTAPPNARVTYDLNDPAFPHRSTTGYSRGCTRECCMAAERRRDKERELERLRGIPAAPRTVPAHMAEAAKRHIDDLIENHNASARAIADRLGIGSATILKTLRGKAMSQPIYEAIMSVKPYDVQRGDHTPAAPTALLSGQMQALGYPMSWQGDQCGLGGKTLIAILGKVRRGQQEWVTPDTAAAIAGLAERVAERVADPIRDGIEPRDIARAKSVARRNGFYPPAAYDEDGTLDWRSIPDHPWTVINEACHEQIERLEVAIRNPELGATGLASLTLDYTTDSVPEGSAEHTELVRVEMAYRRLLEGLGIRAIDGGAEKRAELHEALWRFMRRGEGDPVSFCIEFGIVSAKSTKIPSDHPAVAEARAKAKEQSAERRRLSRNATRRDTPLTPAQREAKNRRKREAAQLRREAAQQQQDVAA